MAHLVGHVVGAARTGGLWRSYALPSGALNPWLADALGQRLSAVAVLGLRVSCPDGLLCNVLESEGSPPQCPFANQEVAK